MENFNWIEGVKPGFEIARTVRMAVFCEEQGFTVQSEFDSIDPLAQHLLGTRNEKPVCTGRLFWGEKGEGGPVAHFGRIAVIPEERGKKTGTRLLEEMLKKAHELGATAVILDAQTDKIAFYLRAGFAATGETSLDEGVHHTRMKISF